MINANELRVGNLVNIVGKNSFNISGVISVDDIINGCGINMHHDHWMHDLEYINPIPLSEEMLLKCGFEKTEIGIVLNIKNMQIGLIAMRGKWNLGISGPFGLIQPRYIEFLHDLQNIVHALTGQELNTSKII